MAISVSNQGIPPIFTGATSLLAGRAGRVPKPNAGDQRKVLYGAGGWEQMLAEDMDIFDRNNIMDNVVNRHHTLQTTVDRITGKILEISGEGGALYTVVKGAAKRYLSGADEYVPIAEYDKYNTLDFDTIHVDKFDFEYNDAVINADAQDLEVTGFSLGDNGYVLIDTEGDMSISKTPGDGTDTFTVGGFHYGRIRKSETIADVDIGIVPNSIWTLLWRPSCLNPNAMVYLGNGIWGDIYLTSNAVNAVNGIGGQLVAVSAYNSIPVTGSNGYNWFAYIEALAKIGKRLPRASEFIIGAMGSPIGADNNNDNAYAATDNATIGTCGTIANAVSSFNVCDLVGRVEKMTSEILVRPASSANDQMVDTGKGFMLEYALQSNVVITMGGDYTAGENAGPRSLMAYVSPVSCDATCGVWAVCNGV